MSLRCGPWARHIYPTLLLVQPRKTRPFLTERLLMGRKESNQTQKNFEFVLLYTRRIVHSCFKYRYPLLPISLFLFDI